MTPWVLVAILSVIIVVSLVVLFLFCCKDKLNFLSGNFCSGSCSIATICGRSLSMLLIKAYSLTPQ